VAVLIDSSVWVDYFRNPRSRFRTEVDRLLRANDAVVVGVVYAELLRGARTSDEFNWFRDHFSQVRFDDSTAEIWERAGFLLFQLRRTGSEIPFPDAVIAAHALHEDHALLTTDEHFKRVSGLRMHEVRP
jgi:predicted nucleic acid-binding protein